MPYGSDELTTPAVTTGTVATANSPEELCNLALMSLGAAPINSLDDLTDRARICKALWPMVLDDEIMQHAWKCCRKRATLALLAAAPAFGYSYRYQLPTDCMRVLELSDDTIDYEVEDGELLTDNSTCQIIYLFRNTVIAKYSAGFKAALVARLTAELAMPITKKDAIVKSSWAAYWGKLAQALAADGQQGSPRVVYDSTLTYARS